MTAVWQITSSEFPFGIAAELAELRAEGLGFDDAWKAINADVRARDAGFVWRSHRGHAEASLPFSKRHFRAAYERNLARSYCVVTTCVEFSCDEYGLCSLHATYKESIAA